jgi:EAL domain-containing protein (putative c-di-GMP-specific phosphodiesterase class I)/GGDEF domain-containing protein
MTLHTLETSQPASGSKSLQEHLQNLALYDQETGLLNHDALLDIVAKELTRKLIPQPEAAFIEMRINGLSTIGNVHGRHAIGFVIRKLADRLQLSNLNGAVYGRLDHNSFGVFLPEVHDGMAAMDIARRLLNLCKNPVDLGNRQVTVDVFAGVALTSENERDAVKLIDHASLAIAASAIPGNPGYAFFNPRDEAEIKRRNDLVAIVTNAVNEKTFTLVFQPFFDVKTGGLLGCEALMRLYHSQYGAISPMEFIPIAEEAGLISKLGAWCIEEACRTAAEWPSHLVVAVNFSAKQFYSGTLISEVNQALDRARFPAYRLEVEITESAMLQHQELVTAQLNVLKEMGCSIALDDFGTGYSSLSYLWQFPFSKLKIDRSFINALGTSSKASSILKAIIDLGQNLGLTVTAEGIETPEQLQSMRDLNCDTVQGYLTGRPVNSTDLSAMLLKNFSDRIKLESNQRKSARQDLPKLRITR